MRRIYLDNAATTKTSKEAAVIAAEVMFEDYGNPSSLHELGLTAFKRIATAREQIAQIIDARPEELIFTSGGTESNNMAIIGVADANIRRGKRIISTKLEHASVVDSLNYLAGKGFEIVMIPTNEAGVINLEIFENAITEDTILVTSGLINSELGTIAPISEMSKIIKSKNSDAYFHIDGVQAFGKIPMSVSKLGADLLTISGHKIHAPKGVGGLYIKDGVRINPSSHGGDQELGMRAGTENVPAIAAFGEASRLAYQKLNENLGWVSGLHQYFMKKAENFLGIRINSSTDSTPYICNISVPGYRSQILLNYLSEKSVYVSSGSACAKGAKSHVLTSIGLSNQRIDSAIRVSFCKDNTTEEIDYFFELLKKAREELIRS